MKQTALFSENSRLWLAQFDSTMLLGTMLDLCNSASCLSDQKLRVHYGTA
jgi:hypothetical protein